MKGEEEVREQEEEKRKREERILRELGEVVDKLTEEVGEIAKSNPLLGEKAYKAVFSRFRKGMRRVYDAQAIRVPCILPPSWRLYFEASREYAFAQNWIKTNTNTQFVAFCVKTVIKNIIRRLRAEDAELVRLAKESEQSSEGNDKSREGEKDNQR